MYIKTANQLLLSNISAGGWPNNPTKNEAKWGHPNFPGLPSVINYRGKYRGNYRGNVTVKKHNYRYRGVRYRDKPHLPTPLRPLP